MKYSILIAFVILLASCEKKELPAPSHVREDVSTGQGGGELITNQVDMGSTYKNQIWFSLSGNTIISTNQRTDWDLAFECSSSGNHVMLNGSKGMKLYKTASANITMVTDTAGLEANSKIDSPSGKMDSTAIGNWEALNTVYVVNRGYNESGAHQGYYKLKMISATAGSFTFEYGDIFGTQIQQAVVNKHPDYNFVMFSFTTGNEAYIEPKKTAYDLCFTVYTHYFINPFQFYQVTGVLHNSYNTRVINIRNKPFTDITLSDTIGRQFSTDRNSIGYEWKSFSLNTNLFTIDPTHCYIIHDHKGSYYKLHFIDFYNTSGIKGVPKFEFRRL